MLKMQNHWERFVSNKGAFKKTDLIYPEVYFINVLWTIGIVNSLYFLPFNFFVFRIMQASLTNILVIIAMIGLMICFHKTNNYKVASMVTILFLIAVMIIVISIYGQSDYNLMWLSIVPVFTFSLFGKYKNRLIITCLFFLCLVIYFNFDSWESTGFSYRSAQTVFGVLVIIILTMRYFDGSRREALKSLELVNLQLKTISEKDHLTSLCNRKKIDTIIEDEISRASRGGVIHSQYL